MNNDLEEKYNSLISEYNLKLSDLKKTESQLAYMIKESDDLSILIKSGDFISKMESVRLILGSLNSLESGFQLFTKVILFEVNRLCSYDKNNLYIDAAIDNLKGIIAVTPSTSPALETLKQNLNIVQKLDSMLRNISHVVSSMPNLEHYMQKENDQWVYYDFVKSFFRDKINAFKRKYCDTLHVILGLCNGDESIKKIDDRYKSMCDVINDNSDIGMINRIDRWMADVDIECARFYNLDFVVKSLCIQNPGLEFACPFKYQGIGGNILFCSDVMAISSSMSGVVVLDRNRHCVKISVAGKEYHILPATKAKRSFVNGDITMDYNGEIIYLENLIKCVKTTDGSQGKIGMLSGHMPRNLKKKYKLEEAKVKHEEKFAKAHDKVSENADQYRDFLNSIDSRQASLSKFEQYDDELRYMSIAKNAPLEQVGFSGVSSKFMTDDQFTVLIHEKIGQHNLRELRRIENYNECIDGITEYLNSSIEKKRK